MTPEETNVNMEQNVNVEPENTGAEVTPQAEIIPEVAAEEPVKKEIKKKAAPSEPPAEFDWDSIGKKHELYSSDERKRYLEI